MACTQCPDGKYCSNGILSNCPEGAVCSNGSIAYCSTTYGWNGSSCTKCNGTTYSPGGFEKCSQCPDGHTCSNGSISNCKEGEWCTNGELKGCIPDYIWNDTTCNKCPDGYYKSGYNYERYCSPSFVCPDYGICEGTTITGCETGYVLYNNACHAISMRRSSSGLELTELNAGDTTINNSIRYFGPPIPIYTEDDYSWSLCQSYDKLCVKVSDLSIAVKLCKVNSDCSENGGFSNCWVGTTANPTTKATDAEFTREEWFKYSETTRTVCTRQAAENICNYQNMIVPNYNIWKKSTLKPEDSGGPFHLCSGGFSPYNEDGAYQSCEANKTYTGINGKKITYPNKYLCSMGIYNRKCFPSYVFLSNNYYGYFITRWEENEGGLVVDIDKVNSSDTWNKYSGLSVRCQSN